MALNANAQKWVEALRSGKFEQGQLALCRDNKYCCLGVACEVALQNGVELTKESKPMLDGRGKVVIETQFDYEWAYLPKPVQDWLGLKNNRGEYIEENMPLRGLAILNDKGASFEDIANVIEKESEEFFV